MWTTVLQGCLNVLDAWLLCDRHATSLTTLWRHRPRPLARFYLVGRQREENGRASYATGSQRSLQERGQSTILPLRGNAESRVPTFSPGLQDGQIDPGANVKLSWLGSEPRQASTISIRRKTGYSVSIGLHGRRSFTLQRQTVFHLHRSI